MLRLRACCRTARAYTSAAQRLASCTAEDMTDIDYLVIGGGVVGLAIGRQLAARPATSTLVVDKNRQLGMETSSRNSEVIHAGIHYPASSLRTKLCIEGKHLLYDYCHQHAVPHSKIGKWVVAQDDPQTERLHTLAHHCADVGVPAQLLGRAHTAAEEPCVRASAVLASPTTGIVDSHALMLALLQDLRDRSADYAPCAEVLAIYGETGGGYRVLVATGDSDTPYMAIHARAVVNAAGLWADRIANMLVSESHEWRTKYRLHFAKGCYYAYTPASDATPITVRRLVYPIPDRHATSLGTHLTLDMAGAIRFGPDLEWISSNADYAVDSAESTRSAAAAAIATYLPQIRAQDLSPDYAGIRPKLQPPGGAFRDFVVQEESAAGFPAFVNLVGIESPGLTASLAIARMVDGLLH
ncbi:hypothetical protein H4S08_000163 [Coemansia sp. RSA 1365]|nr:hypothetical protein H4S08_000163 [Coemansia sp. RSA 1365]